MPLASVVCEPPVREPPPEATVKVTATPETGLPWRSVTSTAGAVPTFVFTVALCVPPALTAIEPAVSATPVAWNVTLPAAAVAVRVLAPAVVPSFQEPTVATPLAFVLCERPVADPPPEATAKVTATPATGLPKVSVTSADGAVETLLSTVALWPSPPLRAIVVAAPAVPVAWNVTLPTPAVAESVFAPAVWPSFQLPTVAIPLEFVVALPTVTEPPPVAAVNVTPTPATGLPNASETSTDGAVETFVSTVADWLSPALTTIVAAAAEEMSKPLLVAPVSEPDVAASV